MNLPGENGFEIHRAHDLWIGGDALEAGRLVFESLPNEIRPKWAAKILRLVLDRSRADASLFAHVLYDADHESLWGDGHRAFSILRDMTLQLDNKRHHGLSEEQEQLASLLALAELVAKVTYNASNPPNAFDEDSGWWIAACLKGFVDWWHDEEFSTAAWSALCSCE